MRNTRFIDFARGLTRSQKAIGAARGLTSRGQSNSSVGSLKLHDWCFGLAQRAPLLYGVTEGIASEAADVRLESFGLSRGLSAAAESAFPEGVIASILRDTSGAEGAREAALFVQSNGTIRGLGSLPESNSTVVNPNLRDRCFRVARQAPSLRHETPPADECNV